MYVQSTVRAQLFPSISRTDCLLEEEFSLTSARHITDFCLAYHRLLPGTSIEIASFALPFRNADVLEVR